jgi:hypothetical protein
MLPIWLWALIIGCAIAVFAYNHYTIPKGGCASCPASVGTTFPPPTDSVGINKHAYDIRH